MAIVAVAAAGVRIWLTIAFPIIFGGDSMGRLLHRDQILLGHQLPLLQLCLYLLNLLTPAVWATRVLMLAISVVAAEGFYRLAEHFAGPRAALLSALLFATDPMVTAVSIVPYQEILMLAGLLFACDFFLRRQFFAASLCLAVACFTRYEAWAMCPVMALAYFRNRKTTGRAVAAVILFGWAPLVWVAWQHGLSPSGSFVVDHAITLRRLLRLEYIRGITAHDTPLPVQVLALAGAVIIFLRGGWRRREVQSAAVFAGLFLVALLFSAHGDPPDPDRYVSSREAHLPITMLILVAAVALERLRLTGALLAVAGMTLGAAGARDTVRHETSRPEIRLGYEAARYLNERALTGNVLILAQPIPDAAIQQYIEKMRETGGEAAVREARQILAASDTSPSDFQRFRVHSNIPRERLFAAPRTGVGIDWIVAWSNFVPPDNASAEWMRTAFARPDVVLRCENVSVAIRRAR